MRPFNCRRLIRYALILALGQVTAACAQTTNLAITGSGQGQVGFSSTAIGELSGITYLGDDRFIVVSDTNATRATATIVIDRTTGQITSASHLPPVSVAGGSDLEGIAYDPRDGHILISDESGNTIKRHAVSDGTPLGSISVPSIYSNARGNLGLESLSLDPFDFNLWTANEEALSVDGNRSTDTVGTIVRLQRFDAAGQPSAQFGYLTQPHSGDSGIFNISGQSGVSDLVALPGGRLIVMERELGGAIPSYRNRLYLMDDSNATDTTTTASLDGVTTGLVEKELLYQVNANFSNFEGIALGPMLNNGDFAMVLVSDDGAPGNPQNLLTLRLSGLAVAGDLTGDMIVNEQDLAVVLNDWGSAVSSGDLLAGDPSGDGQVGIEDLELVLANWSNASPVTNTVPEPGMGSITAAALVLLTRRW